MCALCDVRAFDCGPIASEVLQHARARDLCDFLRATRDARSRQDTVLMSLLTSNARRRFAKTRARIVGVRDARAHAQTDRSQNLLSLRAQPSS